MKKVRNEINLKKFASKTTDKLQAVIKNLVFMETDQLPTYIYSIEVTNFWNSALKSFPRKKYMNIVEAHSALHLSLPSWKV